MQITCEQYLQKCSSIAILFLGLTCFYPGTCACTQTKPSHLSSLNHPQTFNPRLLHSTAHRPKHSNKKYGFSTYLVPKLKKTISYSHHVSCLDILVLLDHLYFVLFTYIRKVLVYPVKQMTQIIPQYQIYQGIFKLYLTLSPLEVHTFKVFIYFRMTLYTIYQHLEEQSGNSFE